MTAPRAQEPLTAELIAGMISTLDFTPSSRHPEECLPLARRIMAEVRRAPSADTRRLDWLETFTDDYKNDEKAALLVNYAKWETKSYSSIRAAIDAAMTQEGE